MFIKAFRCKYDTGRKLENMLQVQLRQMKRQQNQQNTHLWKEY